MSLPFIRDKFDEKNAKIIIALGYPENRDYLSHLLSWLKDMNWPVAKIIQPY